jgi:hypothetical protein
VRHLVTIFRNNGQISTFRTLHIYYSAIFYEIYEKELIDYTIVQLQAFHETLDAGHEFSLGPSWKFYISLKKFVHLSRREKLIDIEHILAKNIIPFWTKTLVQQAHFHIEKLLFMESFSDYETSKRISSSAIDFLDVLSPMHNFWLALDLVNDDIANYFKISLIKDIDNCFNIYVNNLLVNLSAKENNNNFDVTPNWCLAVNNIEHIMDNLEPILGQSFGNFDAELLLKTENIVYNKLIDNIGSTVTVLLQKGSKSLKKNVNSYEKLLLYFEQSLEVGLFCGNQFKISNGKFLVENNLKCKICKGPVSDNECFDFVFSQFQ